MQEKSRDTGPGLVYFVEAVGSDRIKIGFTRRGLAARFVQLKANSPIPLEVMGVIDGVPKKREYLTHHRFKALWCHGEWFRAEPELREWIAEHATPWVLIPLPDKRPIVSTFLDRHGKRKQTVKEWAALTELTYYGETKTIADWAKIKGKSVLSLKWLLQKGVIPENLFLPLPIASPEPMCDGPWPANGEKFPNPRFIER